MSDPSSVTSREPPTKSIGGKRKISKRQKIQELRGDRKKLEEANRRLREELQTLKISREVSSQGELESPTVVTTEDEIMSSHEKTLLETIQGLKETNARQRRNLEKMEAKEIERKGEVLKKDQIIANLRKEVFAFTNNDEISQSLDTRGSADIEAELQSSRLEKRLFEIRNQILSCQLDASQQKEASLQHEVDSLKSTCMDLSSKRSRLSKSTDSSSALLSDSFRLKEELDNKIERIVLLELDLEMCQEELQELRERCGIIEKDDEDISYTDDDYSSDSGDEVMVRSSASGRLKCSSIGNC